MTSVRRFEAGLAEPLCAEYEGERYRLKGAMPALPILRGVKARLSGELDQEANSAMILEVLEAGFEAGELDRLLRTGVTFDTLTAILMWAMAVWAGEEPAAEGEAPPPETGALPGASLSESTSLRPTSNGTTESTSGPPSEQGSTGDGSLPSSTPSQKIPSGG